MLVKHAAFEVLSKYLATGVLARNASQSIQRTFAQGTSTVVYVEGWGADNRPLLKSAHRADFVYDPRPGYLYVRSRAISSRTNDNFDTFPAEEIRQAWATFVGKPVFVNHHNSNHRRARGVIVAAALHEDINPDGTPDTWTEVLMEIDAVRFPKLSQAIIAGHIERTSMGTDVALSRCSFCGHEARHPLEYCQHIPRMKGQWIYRTTASGSKERVLVHEICYGLGFFENSLLVEPPADPTAHFLGVDTRGMSTTASRHQGLRIHYDPEAGTVETVTEAIPSNLGRCYELAATRAVFGEHGPDPSNGFKKRGDGEASLVHGTIQGEGLPPLHHAWVEEGDKVWEPASNATYSKQGFKTLFHPAEHHRYNPHDAAVNMVRNGHYGPWEEGEQSEAKTAIAIPLTLHLSCGHTTRFVGTNRRAMSGLPKAGEHWTCPEHGEVAIGKIEGPGKNYNGLGLDMWEGPRAASLAALASLADMPHLAMPVAEPTPLTRGVPKKPKFTDPAQHPGMQHLGISSDNVYNHWKQANDSEKAHGMRWYEDAHHMANLMGMGNSDVSAGILSAYSPQASWPQNLLNAARTIRTGKAVGPGEGAMAMHQKAAQRIMGGEHWSKVLTAPKTYAFAHLISTGGKDSDTGANLDDVVIDRHALSVAAGRRVTDADPEDVRAMGNVLKNPFYYNHVANAYRDAAKRISAEEGREIAPHQVQAVTWLARQRLNEAEMDGLGGSNERLRRGRDTMERNYQTKFDKQVNEEWPDALRGNMHAARLESLAALQTLAKDDYREGPWRHPDPLHPYYQGMDALDIPPGDASATDNPDDAWEDGFMDGIEGKKPMSLKYSRPEHADAYWEGHQEGSHHSDKPYEQARAAALSALRSIGYGEIKAPPEVDTLRDEACPICGNDDETWNGDNCATCGYKAPPEDFRDPDLDKAKQHDLRKDNEDDAQTEQGQMNNAPVPTQTPAQQPLLPV